MANDTLLKISTVDTVPETDRSSSAKIIACTRAALATCLLSISLAGPAQSAPANPDTSSPSTSLQVTKENGYGQIASNGKSFQELTNLSIDEMGKLPEKIQIELEKWMDQQNNNKQQVVVSLEKGNNEKKQVVVSKQIEGKQLDQVVVSLEKGNNEKKQVVASLDTTNNAIKSSIKTKWINLTGMLEKLNTEGQKSLLMQDPDGNRKILEYVIANNLPPPTLAKNLLHLITA